jgi:uncharacterized protein YqjF (DUF2071 family)
MLNYEIEPSVLAGRVPAGCELDSWAGRTFVSVVGFEFLHTRVLRVPVPFHRRFEEVNLRFYVRRKAEGIWRRGVVFVKELVPRWAIAWVARHVYGENYVSLPMRHSVKGVADAGSAILSYQWRRGEAWEGLCVEFSGSPALPSGEAEETFITEHYWGYSQRRDGSTFEYQVEHPRWPVWRAEAASLECDAASLYGPEFVEALSTSPSSAFVAEGSPVVVYRGHRLS